MIAGIESSSTGGGFDTSTSSLNSLIEFVITETKLSLLPLRLSFLHV